MIRHRIVTRAVELRNYVFHLFDITFYVGTEKEKTVTAAEASLEDFVWNAIEAVDKQYNYYVPELVEDETEIIQSVWDSVYEKESISWEPAFEIVH